MCCFCMVLLRVRPRNPSIQWAFHYNSLKVLTCFRPTSLKIFTEYSLHVHLQPRLSTSVKPRSTLIVWQTHALPLFVISRIDLKNQILRHHVYQNALFCAFFPNSHLEIVQLPVQSTALMCMQLHESTISTHGGYPWTLVCKHRAPCAAVFSLLHEKRTQAIVAQVDKCIDGSYVDFGIESAYDTLRYVLHVTIRRYARKYVPSLTKVLIGSPEPVAYRQYTIWKQASNQQALLLTYWQCMRVF